MLGHQRNMILGGCEVVVVGGVVLRFTAAASVKASRNFGARKGAAGRPSTVSHPSKQCAPSSEDDMLVLHPRSSELLSRDCTDSYNEGQAI